MSELQDMLQIQVEYSVEDEAENGVYIATNDLISLVTQGYTWDELMHNLKEAIDVCLDETDTIAEFNLSPNPRIQLIINLPENYAEIA